MMLEGLTVKRCTGSFYCSYNNLTSLKGAPKEVGEDFYCTGNNLTSLDGAPEQVGEDFWCRYNDVNFTEEDVKDVCDVKGTIYV